MLSCITFEGFITSRLAIALSAIAAMLWLALALGNDKATILLAGFVTFAAVASALISVAVERNERSRH